MREALLIKIEGSAPESTLRRAFPFFRRGLQTIRMSFFPINMNQTPLHGLWTVLGLLLSESQTELEHATSAFLFLALDRPSKILCYLPSCLLILKNITELKTNVKSILLISAVSSFPISVQEDIG